MISDGYIVIFYRSLDDSFFLSRKGLRTYYVHRARLFKSAYLARKEAKRVVAMYPGRGLEKYSVHRAYLSMHEKGERGNKFYCYRGSRTLSN